MLRLLLTLSLLMKQSERTCSVLQRSAGLLAWLAIPLNGYSPFFCPIFSKVNGYAPFFNRVLWIFLAFLTLFIPFFWVGMLRFIHLLHLFRYLIELMAYQLAPHIHHLLLYLLKNVLEWLQ